MSPAGNANPPGSALRLFRPDDPYIALGLAVGLLMTKPAFARLAFGDWSRILAGQISRRHYCFVVDDRNVVHGFLGWALTSEDKAEAWLGGSRGLGYADCMDGNCVVINAWAASGPGANRRLMEAARRVARGRKAVYFKRHDQRGGVRAVRLALGGRCAPREEIEGRPQVPAVQNFPGVNQ